MLQSWLIAHLTRLGELNTMVYFSFRLDKCFGHRVTLKFFLVTYFFGAILKWLLLTHQSRYELHIAWQYTSEYGASFKCNINFLGALEAEIEGF